MDVNMVIEIFLILLFIFFCIKHNSKEILYFVFFLLPIHGTIKFVIFHSGGEIFAIWKEIGILFIYFKELRKTSYSTKSLFLIYLILAFVTLIFAIVGYENGFSITGSIKKLLFPCLLTIAVSKIKFSEDDIRHLLLYMFVGSILINITGVLDFFNPSIREIFRNMMRIGYSVSDDGTIFYDTNSFTIMGYERAFGLMAGGPNQMGIFNAGILFFIIISILYYPKIYNNLNSKCILFIAMSLSAFCLIVSFSRAGMAMLFIALLILSFYDKRLRSKIIWAILFFIIVLFIAAIYSHVINDVIISTLSGKEVSSASRVSMVNDAWNFLLNNPWGYGLGAVNSDKIYFAESSIINFGIEIGICGLMVLFILFVNILCQIKKNFIYCKISKCSFSFFIAYIITSFVSVNPFENPFIYYAWLLLGLGLERINYPITRKNLVVRK